MSCRSETSSPNSRHGDGTRCDHPAAQCPQDCPTVEIEINDTSATDDDLVLVKCERPSRRHNISCRIRSTGSGNTDSVVLTNLDGRLRFPNSGDTTKSLTVRDDGQWVPFEISGELGSDAMNDAVIQARCMSDSGPVIGTKTVTVVHFDQAEIDITTGGTYRLTGGRFTATGGNGVDYSAEARIRPAGVDCSQPQVRDLRIGIAQNTFPPRIYNWDWDSPAIAWNAGVAAGTTVTVPSAIRRTINVAATANDSEATVAPLYDQPGKGGTLDADSLKPPTGCAGAAAATTHDTPALPAPATLTLPAQTAAGATVGNVTYPFVKVTHNAHYRAWVVVFNTATNDFCTLRERVWSTNMDSSAAGAQRPTVAAETDPTTNPLTAPPFSNAHSNDPANRTQGAHGAATQTFTAP